jgi:hypothetical protein
MSFRILRARSQGNPAKIRDFGSRDLRAPDGHYTMVAIWGKPVLRAHGNTESE